MRAQTANAAYQGPLWTPLQQTISQPIGSGVRANTGS
jgi:hypothetical protein